MLPDCRLKRVDGRALVLTLVDACTGAFFQEKCPYKEFHRRLRHQEQRLKKLSETCTNPEVRFLAQEYCYTSNFFFLTLSMLSMRINLFNSVNNSECMKQHCTPPFKRDRERYLRKKEKGVVKAIADLSKRAHTCKHTYTHTFKVLNIFHISV